LKLTNAGDYGLQAVLYLARLADGETAILRQIAEEEGIPECFLRKVFQALARAGLVLTSRGVGGGVVLARPPSEISVLDIVEAIEGQVVLNTCLLEHGRCDKAEICPLVPAWQEAQDGLRGALMKWTIEEALNNNK
jgi:Rrf2 family protein